MDIFGATSRWTPSAARRLDDYCLVPPCGHVEDGDQFDAQLPVALRDNLQMATFKDDALLARTHRRADVLFLLTVAVGALLACAAAFDVALWYGHGGTMGTHAFGHVAHVVALEWLSSSGTLLPSSTLCLQDHNGSCWAERPGNTTDTCTARSGTSTCRCPAAGGVACNINELRGTPPITGRCNRLVIYVPSGNFFGDNTMRVVVGSGTIEMYCTSMVMNDQWQDKHLVAQASDGPQAPDLSWIRCHMQPLRLTWRNGKCYRTNRYLGESCWSGTLFGSCTSGASMIDAFRQNIAGGSASEYTTKCSSGVCMPTVVAETLKRCSCASAEVANVKACSGGATGCGDQVCMSHPSGSGDFQCDPRVEFPGTPL
mmetsp:Transcript_38121/g.104969  ORF Transcript_38121/g.104969 Transcript_38121/m.104969 type:complete len:371 (-) Transcript_38121:142-1254(-)